VERGGSLAGAARTPGRLRADEHVGEHDDRQFRVPVRLWGDWHRKLVHGGGKRGWRQTDGAKGHSRDDL